MALFVAESNKPIPEREAFHLQLNGRNLTQAELDLAQEFWLAGIYYQRERWNLERRIVLENLCSVTKLRAPKPHINPVRQGSLKSALRVLKKHGFFEVTEDGKDGIWGNWLWGKQ